MDFLKQFENKFLPFDFYIILGPSLCEEEPYIDVDIVNNPFKLEKGPVIYTVDDSKVESSFFVYTSDGKKVASVQLSLTHSGRIISQDITYLGPNNLSLRHRKEDIPSSVIPYESFTFERGNETDYKRFEITQVNNNVIGAKYYSKIQNRTSSSPFQTYLSSSLFTKPSSLGDYLETPYDSQGMDNTLLKYNATKARFMESLCINDSCSDNELQKKINLYKGNTRCNEVNIPISTYTMLNHTDLVAAYLANEENNLLNGFRGNFIGSIHKHNLSTTKNNTTELLCPLVVVTEQIKDDNTYHCYTLLDTPDIDTIRKSKKEPKYVTQIGENGEEQLVLYNGKPISKLASEMQTEAEASYASFVKEFITPFSGIQPIKIEQFMQQKDQSRESR